MPRKGLLSNGNLPRKLPILSRSHQQQRRSGHLRNLSMTTRAGVVHRLRPSRELDNRRKSSLDDCQLTSLHLTHIAPIHQHESGQETDIAPFLSLVVTSRSTVTQCGSV